MIKHLLKIPEIQAFLLMIFGIAVIIFVPYIVGSYIVLVDTVVFKIWIIGFLRSFFWVSVAAASALALFGIGVGLCKIFNKIVRALENRKIENHLTESVPFDVKVRKEVKVRYGKDYE